MGIALEDSLLKMLSPPQRGELVIVDDMDRKNEGDLMLIRLVVLIATCGSISKGMSFNTADIRHALGDEYEFVYRQGWADESVELLDDIVANEGPFYGLMGNLQGAAFVSVDLSKVPVNTFEVAVMFCGYPTTTHLG